MNIRVITSFSQAYYDAIGHRAVETWLRHWPQDLTLTCYAEQCKIPSDPRIQVVDFDVFDRDYWQFQQDDSIKSRAKTFAKKAWSFMHAASEAAADRVIWLDADVITQEPLSRALLTEILPDWAVSTHLGVIYQQDKQGRVGPWLVPETGFFAVNRRHDRFDALLSEYRRRYLERDHADLRRFYDNDVYGAAVKHSGAESLDLCAGLPKPYKTPMRHTVLHPYLCHYKARNRKEQFQIDCQ